MFAHRTTVYSLALGLLALTAVGCSDDPPTTTPTETTVYGANTAVNGGNVRSFMKLDASGNPMEVGLRISKRTVDSGSMTPPANPMENMIHIALPDGMAAKTAFQDISLDWGPEGHPPAFYSVPHFDMHFYTVPANVRMAWSPTDTAKLNRLADPSLVPPGYIAPEPVGIPFMGLHYIDPTSPEFNGGAFTSTFIWGYYDGGQVFMEPMITQAFLQSKAAFQANIALPTQFTRTGVYYPTKYSISYDAATNEHVVTMGSMVKK
jgi:hypothetical protein